MAVLLVGLISMTILLTVVMPVWKQTMQREKETELVFRGEQYARAIGLFQRKYANAFPPNFDVLVEQHFLRKKYKDPITNDDFLPLLQQTQATPGTGSQAAPRPGQTAPAAQANRPGGVAPAGVGAPGAGPAGGLIGVASKSKDTSIRIYKGRSHYNEWAFVFVPQAQAPVVPGIGAPGVPGGQRGGPGGVPPPTSGPGGLCGRGGRGGRGGPDGPGGRGPGVTPIFPPTSGGPPRPPGR